MQTRPTEKEDITAAMGDNSLNDVDARSIFGRLRPPPDVSGSIQCPADSEEYPMNHPKRGKCFIFNNKVFEPTTGLNIRNGTDADAARLYCRFKELQFDVSMFPDCRAKDIEKELQKVAKEDLSDYSCFVCCILSHGEYGILYGSDGKYSTERVFAPFRGDVCPTLIGKPKVFFIQACQGDRLDSGVHLKVGESTDSGSDGSIFRIPTHADFLITYSTVPGFYSWRNTTNGSWFVQALCSTLQKHAKDLDLLSILTIVNRRVAYDYESYVPTEADMHLKKQVPFITSTLTRKIKFPVP